MADKELKQRYRKLFEQTREIINRYLGLVEDGAPIDEWDDETARILALLVKDISVDELAEGIGLVLEQSLGESSRRSSESLKRLATELIKMRNELRWERK